MPSKYMKPSTKSSNLDYANNYDNTSENSSEYKESISSNGGMFADVLDMFENSD